MEENNELLFKNTSKIDSDEISLFQKYALKKTVLLSSIIFSTFFILLGIGLCFVDITMGVISLVAGVAGGCVLLPYLMTEAVKRQNKAILGDRKYLNTFEFYQDHIFISSEATSSLETNDYQKVASQNLYYNEIVKFVIYKERLFIFINKYQSFILNYRGMTYKTADELIEFLVQKGIKKVDKTKVVTPPVKSK